MTNFLPTDYKEVPQAPSNYMKFKPGPNRFRILSHAIVGYEYWNMLNKPVRQRQKFDTIPADIKIQNGKVTDVRHFWAFVVWNYEAKMIQILEIIQASIQRQMKIKIDNRGGDATGYDFIVTRSGEGMDTEYDVDTGEREPVSDEIMKQYQSKNINLEALYNGGDPFNSSPNAQKEPTGYEKAKAVANSLPGAKPVSQGQIAPDIQEIADQMESEGLRDEDIAKIPFN